MSKVTHICLKQRHVLKYSSNFNLVHRSNETEIEYLFFLLQKCKFAWIACTRFTSMIYYSLLTNKLYILYRCSPHVSISNNEKCSRIVFYIYVGYKNRFYFFTLFRLSLRYLGRGICIVMLFFLQQKMFFIA